MALSRFGLRRWTAFVQWETTSLTLAELNSIGLSRPLSTPRLLSVLALGGILWLLAVVASEFIPLVLLGMELEGGTYALVGVLRIILAPLALALALKITSLPLRDLSLRFDRMGPDAALGLAVAVAFALLQFLVVFPLTGGAERTDIAVGNAQVGDEWSGLVGHLVFAWTGSVAEELFFRGFLLTLLLRMFGRTTAAATAATVIVVVLFASGHGYQGWAGIVDTAVYGGLVLTALFLYTQRLTACIVAHAMWNTLATFYLWYY